MFTNYIKTSLRVLLKHKAFSAINIFGLAISMSVCLLIMLFLIGQRSYDTFHEHDDRIYRIYSDYKAQINSSPQLYATAPITLGAVLENEYSGIEEAVRIYRFGGQGEYEGKEARISGYYTTPSFFRVFSFDLVEGNPETALNEPNSIVISQEVATRFFGIAPAMGNTLLIEGNPHTVTGVLGEPAGDSHLQFEALRSFATLESGERAQNLFENWHATVRSSYVFVLLDEDASPGDIEAQLPGLIERHYPADDQAWLEGLHLQALTNINLGKIMDNQLSVILPSFIGYFLMFLGGVVMFAACFNYVSLTVARALTRAREVGMRKVTGARRFQIVGQFISESVFISLLSLGIAVMGLALLLPRFNSLWFITFSGNEISLDLLQDASTYLTFIGFSVAIGVLAGFYPALYLSRFSPGKVLKGVLNQKGASGMWLRKTLVVLQVTFSLVFIVSALIIFQQFQYMVSADYGFDSDNIVNVRLQDVDYDVFREEIAQYPGVAQVSAISVLPMTGSRRDLWINQPGMEQPLKGYRLSVDYNLVDNFGLRIVAGRNFSPEFPADADRYVLVNETAVRALNIGSNEDAIGRPLTLFDDWEVQIVGVVGDFHTNEMVLGMDPIVLDLTPRHLAWANVRVQPGQLETVLPQLEAAWASTGTAQLLDYNLFTAQIREAPSLLLFTDFLGIIGFITLIAIVIACLGLLGIATFTIERRTKEVGIRKVLGAKVPDVVVLLSQDFLRLIAIATVVALPLAWMLNSLWLEQFEFRTELGAFVFILGPAAVLTLVLCAIGSQAFRAAVKDPIETLRYE